MFLPYLGCGTLYAAHHPDAMEWEGTEKRRWKKQWGYRPVNPKNRNRPTEERGKIR